MIQQFIIRNISGKKVLVLFVLTNIIYTIMLTLTIPKVMNFAGGLKLLDMLPAGYTLEYVNQLFSALGTNGRHAYLYNQIPFDLVYPLLFGISYCLLLAYFLQKLGKLNGTMYYLCFIPLFAGFFDYAENLGIITMLNTFPNISALSVKITSLFSVLKSTLTTCYFIVLVVVLIALGNIKLMAKKSEVL